MKRNPFLFLIVLLAPVLAQAQLEWRVSVKFILDANGNLPSNTNAGYGTNSTALINALAVTNQIDVANTILDLSGRGYRYRLTEVSNLTGVSQWFNVAAREGTNRAALEDAALAAPDTYAWRTDAINVYINNNSSGVCSFPGDRSTILLGADAYSTILVHEAGHFFNLSHTHQGEQYLNGDGSACMAANCTCAVVTARDQDGVPDTLPDVQCWTQDQIANNAFRTNYAGLNAAQQNQVNNVFQNIMSYHFPQDRFTSDQLDRLTMASNLLRNNVATGRTWFVDRNNNCPGPTGGDVCGDLREGGPFHTVADGIKAAGARDIVLIRPGNYNEPQTITHAVTLRATRGNVTIGRL